MEKDRFLGATYGTMGMGTEGGTTPYEVKVARSSKTHQPIMASGHAVGAMQFDFGQRGKEPDRLAPGMNKTESYAAAYNAWAKTHGREPLDPDTVRKLQTHNVPPSDKYPNGIKRFEELPAKDQANLEAFGRTSQGKQHVYQHLEKPLLDSYYDKINPMLEKKAFANWTEQEIIVAATTLAKAYNQSATGFHAIEKKLEGKGSQYSPQDFKNDVKAVEVAHAANAKDHKSYYAFSKAHDLAQKVVPLYGDEATARTLDSAGAKLASKSFDPSSIATDPQLQFLKKVNSDPAFLHKTKEAIQGGKPAPEPLQRPPYVTAFETMPPAKALALYPHELAGAVHSMEAAQKVAKSLPHSQQMDFVSKVKDQLCEHLCHKGPVPLPNHQIAHPHSPTPQQVSAPAQRHELSPQR